MVVLDDEIKNQLKKPLGKVYEDANAIVKMIRGKRVISVGDVCTIALLDAGVIPHLAVFDYKFQRTKLKTQDLKTLKSQYPKPKIYNNPAGTISDKIIADAAKLLEAGGAILIDGEEDLTALAFIIVARIGDILIYGQPKVGIVLIRINEKIKERTRKFLSA